MITAVSTRTWRRSIPVLTTRLGLFSHRELEFDFARFIAMDSNSGMIEFRSSFSDVTKADGFLMVLTDPAGIVERVENNGSETLQFGEDGFSGTLHLGRTCPDANQTIMAVNGSVELLEFSTRQTGTIRGRGVFDLVSAREPNGDVIARACLFEFELMVREVPPYEDYAR